MEDTVDEICTHSTKAQNTMGGGGGGGDKTQQPYQHVVAKYSGN